MRKWFALSAIGHDRPGIVADLAEFIFESECNLEDSSMSRLGSEFAVLLLLSSTGADAERRLSAGAKRLEWEKRLTVFIRPLDGEPLRGKPYGVTTFEVEAHGLDKAGIVARVARCLTESDANILEMSTRVRPAAESGTPVYHMSIVIDLPNQVREEELRRRLDEVAHALRIEIMLARRS